VIFGGKRMLFEETQHSIIIRTILLWKRKTGRHERLQQIGKEIEKTN